MATVVAILAAFTAVAASYFLVAAWTAAAGLAVGAVSSWNEAFGVGTAYACSLSGYVLHSVGYSSGGSGLLILSAAIYVVIFADDFFAAYTKH